jgi:uncharacterized protein
VETVCWFSGLACFIRLLTSNNIILQPFILPSRPLKAFRPGKHMSGETDLTQLIKTMTPQLNAGEYVFCKTDNLDGIDVKETICIFKEQEAYTIVLNKTIADRLQLPYTYVAVWITLTVHSSLEAVGLTAAFSTALGNAGISCNVIAAYYHDHIFVEWKDGERAMEVLRGLAEDK